jgi:hypothetical protein
MLSQVLHYILHGWPDEVTEGLMFQPQFFHLHHLNCIDEFTEPNMCYRVLGHRVNLQNAY